MSSDICDRLLRLEIAEANIVEKLSLKNITDNERNHAINEKLDDLTSQQSHIVNMLNAIKFMVVGSVITFLAQTFGLFTLLKEAVF